jgi:hypothetical protein
MFVSEKLIPVTREVRNWENENNKVMTFMTNDVWWRNDELNQNNIVTPLNGRDLYNYSSGKFDYNYYVFKFWKNL